MEIYVVEAISQRNGERGVSAVFSSDQLLRYQLTEQEIKDYDKCYWAFAKEVEE